MVALHLPSIIWWKYALLYNRINSIEMHLSVKQRVNNAAFNSIYCSKFIRLPHRDKVRI